MFTKIENAAKLQRFFYIIVKKSSPQDLVNFSRQTLHQSFELHFQKLG